MANPGILRFALKQFGKSKTGKKIVKKVKDTIYDYKHGTPKGMSFRPTSRDALKQSQAQKGKWLRETHSPSKSVTTTVNRPHFEKVKEARHWKDLEVPAYIRRNVKADSAEYKNIGNVKGVRFFSTKRWAKEVEQASGRKKIKN